MYTSAVITEHFLLSPLTPPDTSDLHSSLLTDFGCTVTEISHPTEFMPPTLHYIWSQKQNWFPKCCVLFRRQRGGHSQKNLYTKCNIPSSEPFRISVKQTNMTTIYVW